MSRAYKKMKTRKFTRTPRNHVSKCLAVALLGLAALASTTEPELVVMRAAMGQDAHLPCGQSKVYLDGPGAFVLWLKNEKEFVHRFPNENTEQSSVTDVDHVYGTTCVEGGCYDDTSLLVKNMSLQDVGRYRCRIHYQASPASDYVIELLLVERPGEPHIYNEEGEEIKQGYVGPVALGATIHLVCVVHDDQSEIEVYWKRNGVALDKAQKSRSGLLRTTVHIENATRDELEAHYECLSQTADVTEPLKSVVVIKMDLPPLMVEIRMNKNKDFEAGLPRVVDCVVIGCVPPPTVTWHMGNKTLRSNVHKEHRDGNFTVSSLSLSPSMHDLGQELICRAHNVNMEGQVFEDKVKINVGYRPHCVSSREGRVGAMPDDVEIVFCVVDSSPPPVQFVWTFADSRTIFTSVRKVSGYPNRYSSVLTWVPCEADLGLLQCHATNPLGEQRQPCIFRVAVGGPPRPPGCSVVTDHPLQVRCKKDWNGGRPQTVHLELYSASKTLLLNVTNVNGLFNLPETAEYERNLTAVVYASSMRGRSETRDIQLYVFRPIDTDSSDVMMETSNSINVPKAYWLDRLELLGWIVGVVVALIVVGVLVNAVCMDRAPVPAVDIDLVATSSDGSFHREPDVAREERLVGTTNVTVNQLGPCQNVSLACDPLNNVTRACSQQCASLPPPACRPLLRCARSEECASPGTMHSYFV